MSHHKKIAINYLDLFIPHCIHQNYSPPLCGFHISSTLGYCNLLPQEHHISSTDPAC